MGCACTKNVSIVDRSITEEPLQTTITPPSVSLIMLQAIHESDVITSPLNADAVYLEPIPSSGSLTFVVCSDCLESLPKTLTSKCTTCNSCYLCYDCLLTTAHPEDHVFRCCGEVEDNDESSSKPVVNFLQVDDLRAMSSTMSCALRCRCCMDNIGLDVAYSCDVCPGYQLCATCMDTGRLDHDATHKFTKTSCNPLSPPLSALSDPMCTPEFCSLPGSFTEQASTHLGRDINSTSIDSAGLGLSESNLSDGCKEILTVTKAEKGKDDEGNKTINLYTVMGPLGQGSHAKV
eukprot:PhF_6_TR7590/c0_g1_i1/m.11164